MPGAQFLLSYAVTPQRASGQEILILLPPPVCSTISAPQHHQPRAAVGFAARHIPATARFRPSGALPKPRAARFRASGVLPRLPRRVSDLRECSQGFPGAFPTFGSAPVASPACFQPLGVLPRLPRRISDLWERSQGFPDTFSAFGSAPVAFPVHFHASGALPLLSPRNFVLRERSRGFRECARRLTSALSASGAEIIQNHFIRRMNHGTDNSGKGERQGARDGA